MKQWIVQGVRKAKARARIVTDVQEHLADPWISAHVLSCQKVRPACAEQYGAFPLNVRWAREDGGFESRFTYVLKDAEVFTPTGEVALEGRLLCESVGDHYVAARRMSKWLFKHALLSALNRIPVLPENEAGYLYIPHAEYYHFLIESLAQLLYSLQCVPEATVLYDETQYHGYYKGYLELLQASGKIKALKPIGLRVFRVPKLVMTAAEIDSGMFCQATVKLLQTALVPPTPASAVGRRIFLTRRGSRRFENQAELEASARAHGLEVVDADGLTVIEQIALFRSAALIVANHGAGLTNLIFMPKGGRVVELFSSRWLNDCYFRLSSLVGLHYDCRVSDEQGEWGKMDDTFFQNL